MQRKNELSRSMVSGLLAIVIIIAMIFGSIPGKDMIANAANAVAEVDGVSYSTFGEALNAWVAKVSTGPITLKLLDNVSMTETKEICNQVISPSNYGNFKLDLNGKTLTYNGDESAIKMGGGSYETKLTVVDSGSGGTLAAPNGKAIELVGNHSTLIIENGTISGNIALYSSSNGFITVKDGTLIGTSSAVSGGRFQIQGGKIVGTISSSEYGSNISCGYCTVEPDSGYVYYGCMVEEKADQTDWQYSDCGFRVVPMPRYNLYVGGTEVTGKELSGDGWSFEPSTYTLTLSGFNFSGRGYSGAYEDGLWHYGGIFYQGSQALTISLSGSNSITSTEVDNGIACAIYSEQPVSIAGNGQLELTSLVGTTSYGIDSAQGITVGTDVNSLVSIGNTKAFKGTVKNAVCGKGWTDTEGTAGEVFIDISNEGAELDYKKVHFPEIKPSVTFDEASMDLKIEESKSIAATVVPNGAEITWKSDNEAVAKVDGTGKVTGVSEGTAKITAAITVDGTEYKAECTVTVSSEPAPVPSVTFNEASMDLKSGESKSITATVVPEGTGITWKSDNEAVAKVDGTGKVTGVSEGTANITGTITVDGTEYKAVCAVTVSSDPAPTPTPTPGEPGVILDANEMEITEGETGNIAFIINPPEAAATVKITSSNEGVAVVSSDGTVTAVAEGTATITVSITVDGKEYSASCTVTVNKVVETKTEENELSDDSIPDAIKELGYDTKEKVQSKLDEVIPVKIDGEKYNHKLLDIRLKVRVNGGEWVDATPEDFPEDGLDVIIPYPAGTDGTNFSFSVAHMVGEAVGNIQAGTVETPGVENREDGLHTRFHGLSPVLITWVQRGAEPAEEKTEGAHVHVYAWDEIRATETTDGELRYQCKICGDIRDRVPLSAYYVFNKNTVDKIHKAKQGETLKITTDRWISFHKMVFDALAERPDVSLEVSFLDKEYKGNRVSVTIPAAADTSDLFKENNFVGFLYLGNKYGLTAQDNKQG